MNTKQTAETDSGNAPSELTKTDALNFLLHARDDAKLAESIAVSTRDWTLAEKCRNVRLSIDQITLQSA